MKTMKTNFRWKDFKPDLKRALTYLPVDYLKDRQEKGFTTVRMGGGRWDDGTSDASVFPMYVFEGHPKGIVDTVESVKEYVVHTARGRYRIEKTHETPGDLQNYITERFDALALTKPKRISKVLKSLT